MFKLGRREERGTIGVRVPVRILSILLVMLIFLSCYPSDGFASQAVSDNQKKLNQINQTIQSTKKKLNQNQKEQQNLSEQIQALDKKIEVAEFELAEINQEIQQTKAKIDRTQKELEKAEKNIASKKDVMNKRLRVMYKNGNIGYIEVLLDSEDIVDLLSKIDMIKRIFKQDTDLLRYMKIQRDEINTKKKTLESHENHLTAMMKNMQQKQQELHEHRVAVSRAREQLQKDSKELEKQIDELNRYAAQIEEQIRRLQSSGEYIGGKLAWPAPGYTRITSPFGYRIHPILKQKKLHTGIDIGIPAGKSVVAAGDGKVIYAATLGGYGKTVMIDHGGGIVTLYAHNSKLLVSKGDSVKRGQGIAQAGSTGMSTGPHLHFEVRKNGKYVDPIPWVK